MLTLNVINSQEGDRINGTVDGDKFNIEFDKEKLEELNDLQKDYEIIEDMDEYQSWLTTVKGIIESSNAEDIISSSCKDLMHDTKTGMYYIKVGSKISKHPVPVKLVAVILESIEKGLDATPIIKSWVRFLRNPNFSSMKAELFANYITAEIVDFEEVDKLVDEEGYTYEKAVDRATYNDVMISNEGLLVVKKYARLLTEGWVIDPETNEAVLKDLYDTKKTVNKFSGEVTETVDYPEYAEELTFEPPIMGRGGNAFYCGEEKDHVVKVGNRIYLESWNQVDTRDNCFGNPGLHVGGLRYVSQYKAYNNQLLECFVDPTDIGAFVDGEDYAIRVKEYFVYGAVKNKNQGLYHASKYAAIKDSEWSTYKLEAIELANELHADVVDFDVN